MLGLGWYAATLVVAFQALLCTVYPRLTLVECILAAVPVGTVVGAWAALACAALFGSISTLTMGMATGLVVLTSLLLLGETVRRLPVALKGVAPGGVEHTAALWTAAVVAILGAASYQLWDGHMLYEKPDGTVWTGGSCWADFPIHMHITNSMLHGRNAAISIAGMHSPIFADRPLTYPYLPDFHAAALVWMGATLRQVYFAVGFACFLSLGGLVLSLGARMTGSHLAAVTGVAVLILMGGIGGIRLWASEGFEGALTRDPVQDDASPSGDHVGGSVFWFAFLPHVFLPQRGATIAYPAVLTVMLILWQAIRPSRLPSQPSMPQSERRFLLIAAALLSGLLALVQAHAFASLAVFVGTVFLLDAHAWLADPTLIVNVWLPAGAAAAAVFFPQWLVFSNMVDGKHSFLSVTAVFQGQGSDAPPLLRAALGGNGILLDFVWCWLRALGPFLPLFSVATASYVARVVQGLAAAAAAARSGAEADPSSLSSRIADAAIRASATDAVLDLHDGVQHFALEHGVGACGSIADAGARPHAAGKKDDDSAAADEPARTEHLTGPTGGWRLLPGEEGPMDPDEAFGFFSRHPLPRSYGIPPGFDRLLRTTDAAVEAETAGGAGPEPAGASGTAAIDDALARAGNTIARVAASVQPFVAGLDAVHPGHRLLSTSKFAVAAAAVFLVGCFVQFQPWNRDNIKVLYVFALVAAPLVGRALTWPVETGLAALFAPSPAHASRVSPADGEHGVAHGDGAAPGPGLRRMDTRDAEAVQDPMTARRLGGLLLVVVMGVASAAVFALGATSGAMGLIREMRMSHELYGPMEKEVGDFIRMHVPPKSVVLTDNTHRAPAGYWAGRPSLAGYDGWLWSHGYDYGERHNDRNFIMDRLTQLDNHEAYDKMRRWGVRYVVAEHKGRPEGAGDNKDMFQDHNIKRIFLSDRYQVFEVLGYGFPPS